MKQSFKIRFWGVRGSYPVPGPKTVRFGGNTSCVQVEAGGHTIILDAGTGIIGLGEHLAAKSREKGHPLVVTILFSHTHHDHIQGFPFFTPAYVGTNSCYLFGLGPFPEDLESALSKAMLSPFFPVHLGEMYSLRSIRTVTDAEMLVFEPGTCTPQVKNIYREKVDSSPDQVHVDTLKHEHPKDGAFLYRIRYADRTVVYATDTEGYWGGDGRVIAFARDADALIHDAHFRREEYSSQSFSRQGWGHSCFEMAAEVAREAGVKRLFLFHHAPSRSDEEVERIEREAQGMFPAAVAAREGMEIDLLDGQIEM